MHVMISELDLVWLLYMLLYHHPYVHSYLHYNINISAVGDCLQKLMIC